MQRGGVGEERPRAVVQSWCLGKETEGRAVGWDELRTAGLRLWGVLEQTLPSRGPASGRSGPALARPRGMCDLGGPRDRSKAVAAGGCPYTLEIGVACLGGCPRRRCRHILNRDVGPSLQELLSKGSVASHSNLR